MLKSFSIRTGTIHVAYVMCIECYVHSMLCAKNVMYVHNKTVRFSVISL